jgi:hypothetical protein
MFIASSSGSRTQPEHTEPRTQKYSKRTPKLSRLAFLKCWARKVIGWTWWASHNLYFLATAIALAVGLYLSFSPRLSVSASDPRVPTNPFSAEFTISNDGPLAIHDVDVAYALGRLRLDWGPIIENTPLNPSDPSFAAIIKQGRPMTVLLNPTEKLTTTFQLPGSKQLPLSEVDIAIWISFRPDWLFWRQEKRFRFTSKRSFDRTWHWQSQAVSDYERQRKRVPL